jgi:hypothetical protein
VHWIGSILTIIIGQVVPFICIFGALEIIQTSSINMLFTVFTFGYIVGSLPVLYVYGKFVPLVVKNA